VHDRSALAKDRIRGRWPEVLAAIGIDPKMLVNRHGPCPVCGGRDRFRFDDRERRGTWICNQCGAGDGWRLVMLFRNVDFVGALELIEGAVGGAATTRPAPKPPQAARSRSSHGLRRIWDAAAPIRAEDAAARYLTLRHLPFDAHGLRLAPVCRHISEPDHAISYHPALLEAYQAPDGRCTGLQRLWLTEDGQKADVMPQRKTIGHLVDGGAVRLMPPAGAVLGIAEGVETALAAAQLFKVPVWAALNAGRLEVWLPPAGITKVMIFGDNDENERGQDAAWQLENRLIDAGIETSVHIPEKSGTDWNDALMRAEVWP
jgi:putative DNA primase/helicase